MRMLYNSTIPLLVVCILSVTALAQSTDVSLLNKIMQEMAEKEPEWRVNLKSIHAHQLVIRWLRADKRAVASVWPLNSRDDAAEFYANRTTALLERPEAKPMKRDLASFGEEAMLIWSKESNGYILIFRRESYVVEMFSRNVDVAERFAHHIFSTLPTPDIKLEVQH